MRVRVRVRVWVGVGVRVRVRANPNLREHPVSELGRREARRELEACEVLVEPLAADLVGVRVKGWR